ncbi:MAG: carbon-nitrogen hydrolase family protein [Pirellulales bacterium]|nr:carbon-nitrogen hydrolase family protein [Pirellulales bacterium]
MIAPYLAAAVQMNSGEDKAANVAVASRLIEEAAAAGAKLIVLPELFNCLGRFESIVAASETIPGPTIEAVSQLARGLSVTIVAGSIAEQTGTPNKAYNTSVILSPTGDLVAKYRKIHLFDVSIDEGPRTTESNWILPGEEVSSVESSCGLLGQTICYDLRFAELYRQLASRRAEVILVPAAFTKKTGEAHWRTLLRARAIENQAYVIAPNQFGANTAGIDTYGHSMIVDPWGEVLAEADGAEEQVVIATIDLARVERVRKQIPALEHRRSWLSNR